MILPYRMLRYTEKLRYIGNFSIWYNWKGQTDCTVPILDSIPIFLGHRYTEYPHEQHSHFLLKYIYCTLNSRSVAVFDLSVCFIEIIYYFYDLFTNFPVESNIRLVHELLIMDTSHHAFRSLLSIVTLDGRGLLKLAGKVLMQDPPF